MNQQLTESAADRHPQPDPVDAPFASATPLAEPAENAGQQAVVAASEPPVQRRQREWAALPYDSVQILRLAPLVAERETGLRPLLFACMSRLSRHSQELSMLRLAVALPEQKIDKSVNHLEVWVDHVEKEIRILPEHGLITKPGNRGLGRLLLAQAIQWCRPEWNDYSMPPLNLKSKLVNNDLARTRRDHALQAQGFTVTYNDAVQMSANCSVIRLEQLGSDWNREKVRIMDHLEAAHLLFSCDHNLKAQAGHINKLKERIGLLQRDDNTLKFTILTLMFFAVFQGGLLIWMATR